MTVQHAIVTFPAFDAPESVEVVRHAFDPQASLLPAHITLVFPFVASQGGRVLREHVASVLAGIVCFDVTLAPPTPEQDAYVFLRVESGRSRIIDLHDRLYSGLLQGYSSPAHAYEPHVTVGRLPSPNALTAAVTSARRALPTPLCARVDSVALFCIENGAGRVEFTMPLAAAKADRSSSAPAMPDERGS
jgi:2'-5' RNA ligase